MKWFKKLFVKDYKSTDKPEVRFRYGATAGIFGLITNAVLFGLKLAVGLIGGSITIIADAVNNLSDAGSSVVTLAGFKLASRPADKEHPYGHARYEYITALVISVIILIIGVLLCKSSVEKIITPSDVTVNVYTYVVLGVAIALKIIQMLVYLDFSKSISSAALKASAMDSRNDVIATSAVLISTIVMGAAQVNIDGYMGVAVSLFIVVSSVRFMAEAANPLIGTPPPKELVDKIKDIIMSHDGVIGMHDLAVHNYGEGRYFAVVHVEVPAKVPIMITHDLVDNIEHDVERETGASITIHMDPVDTEDEELEALKARAEKVLAEMGDGLTLHDFRLVRGATHTNVLFDVTIPFDSKYGLADVTSRMQDEFDADDTVYYFVINVDRARV